MVMVLSLCFKRRFLCLEELVEWGEALTVGALPALWLPLGRADVFWFTSVAFPVIHLTIKL